MNTTIGEAGPREAAPDSSASSTQLRLFVEHAPVALAMLDRDVRYICASRRWMQDYGLEGREVRGLSHYEVFPETTDRWRAIHRLCLAGGVERCEEERFERADGSCIWLRWEVRPWRMPDGSVGGIVIFTEDISEQKQAEAAVDASEERFRAIFEQAAVGMAQVGLDGRWMRVNRKLCDIVGYERDQLMRLTFQDITHADDLKADLALADQLLAGRIDHYSIDKRYIRQGGEAIWIRLTGSLKRATSGEPEYFIAVVEDIDPRIQAEHKLRRLRSEMEEMLTLHVASQTAAAIAHELNQPLNAMTSYTEAMALMLRSGTPQPDKLARAIKGCEHQAKRAGGVVRELMQFLQHGETRTEAIDLHAVIKEALAIVQSNGYGPFTADLHLDLRMRMVQANRMQIEKVLVNLLRNALEAMATGGALDPAVTIGISTASEGGMAMVTVRDVGPGLNTEAMRRVFEPFFTTKQNGIGMGLAVSRALVEANGGRLWVDVLEGPGATFRFTLPLAR